MKNPNSLMNRSKSIHETKQSLDIDFTRLQPKKLNIVLPTGKSAKP